MSAKHTPGPWKNGRTTDGKLVVFHVAPQPATEHCAAEPACAEWVANMQLLDAAPDLLQACKELLSAHRLSARPPATVMQAEAQLDRIRMAGQKAFAAIARAEGLAP